MKRIVLSLAASAAAIALAPSANAAICIATSVNGGALTQQVCDGGSGTANYNATSGGFVYNVGAQGFPLLSMPQLLTQSVNISTGQTATIDVFITQSGLSSLNAGLLSTFTSNTIAGSTAQISSFYSTGNYLAASGSTIAQFLAANTLLQTAGFTGTSTFSAGNNVNLTGPFSETVRYTLNFTGGAGSNFNGTANLTAVPEPATWGLMLLGFGAMGGMLRTRRQTPRVRYA